MCSTCLISAYNRPATAKTVSGSKIELTTHENGESNGSPVPPKDDTNEPYVSL